MQSERNSGMRGPNCEAKNKNNSPETKRNSAALSDRTRI